MKTRFLNMVKSRMQHCQEINIEDDTYIKLPNKQWAAPVGDKYIVIDNIDHIIDSAIELNINIYIDSLIRFSLERVTLCTELQALLNDNNGLEFGLLYTIKDGELYYENHFCGDIVDRCAVELQNYIDDIKKWAS